MSGSAGASGSSATGKNETAGFPPPGFSNPDGGGDSNIEESGGEDSSAATSPPGNDPSTGQSPAPETSPPPPPPPPEASPPPALKQQSPPPPEKQSPPPPEQKSPPPPEEQSPPPPNEQPPPPPKQQTPPSSPPNNPSQNSSPPPPPDKPTSPPPPASSGTPQAPPHPIPEISPSKPSPALSPPPPPSVSPKALAPPPPPPLQSKTSKTQSNSTSGSSSSGISTDSSETNYRVAVGAGAAAGVLILALVALVFCLRRKKKRRQPRYLNYVPPPPPIFPGTAGKNDVYVPMEFSGLNGYNSGVHNQQHSGGYSSGSQTRNSYHGSDSDIIASKRAFFSYEELMEMTNGFSRQNVIGEGGFGCVYKGFLPDGKPVAVKQLKVGSGQGDREFKAEVEIISRVHHKHLVSLVGYCIAENQRLLIYEFVPNKTLEHHLHAKHLPVLDWAKRVKIAEGAAKGLAYLHEDCHPKIIHRDIKSANILLEDDFEAQVADFGLAKLNDTTQTHVSTRVMGTFGYLAPEYASSGKLTDRSDVFSFGVVLLELITGRRPVDATQPLGDESLVEWARPLLINAIETGKFDELVDPRLENHYVEVQMLRMIEAAAACVRHSAAKRPRMVQVARALDFQGDADLSNGVKFGQSTVYNSSQYNEEIMKFRRIALGSDKSSEFNTNSGEYSSRQSCKGRRNSRKSPYNSTDFSSEESETRAFNLPSGEYSTDASGNYDHLRFRK